MPEAKLRESVHVEHPGAKEQETIQPCLCIHTARGESEIQLQPAFRKVDDGSGRGWRGDGFIKNTRQGRWRMPMQKAVVKGYIHSGRLPRAAGDHFARHRHGGVGYKPCEGDVESTAGSPSRSGTKLLAKPLFTAAEEIQAVKFMGVTLVEPIDQLVGNGYVRLGLHAQTLATEAEVIERFASIKILEKPKSGVDGILHPFIRSFGMEEEVVCTAEASVTAVIHPNGVLEEIVGPEGSVAFRKHPPSIAEEPDRSGGYR